MANKLATLVIELAANSARLQSDMGKAVGIAERGAAQIKKAFTFVTGATGGGLIGNALLGAAQKAVKLGDDLQKAATKAGIGGRAMSELAYAAKLADVDLAGLSTSLKKMQITLSQAASGSKEAKQTLEALGLTISDLQGRGADEQFEILAGRIAALVDPADRARAAVEIFGKAGADLLPLFEQGAEGIRKAREEAEKLGFSFGDDQLKKLADADDAVKRLTASWDAFAAKLTEKVAPALTKTLNFAASGGYGRLGEGFLKGGFIGLLSGSAEVSGIGSDPRTVAGRRGGDPSSASAAFAAPGFAAINAAEEAAKASKKAADAERKEQKALMKDLEDMRVDLYRDIQQIADDAREYDYERFLESTLKEAEAARLAAEELAEWKRVHAMQLSEGAQMFRDTMLDAIDSWANGGKLKVDEFVKHALIQFAKLKIMQMFDNMAANKAQSAPASQKGGWMQAIGTFFSAMFSSGSGAKVTTGKARGGTVHGGELVPVGEEGVELFRASGSGEIIPNHQLGGGRGGSFVFAPRIDARGASIELVDRLPRILAEERRQIFDTLNREGWMRTV